MFAEEDENANANPAPDGGNLAPGPDPNNRSSESKFLTTTSVWLGLYICQLGEK